MKQQVGNSYSLNTRHPAFGFLEIAQDEQVAEICARWPLLGALFGPRGDATPDILVPAASVSQ